jgi:dihydrofolate synthase / folylpolyglutamate synthase
MQAAGYRTGLYSSPHLDGVEERLAIDGRACPGDELAELVHRIRPVIAAMDAEPPAEPGASNRPTYFEIITALALLRFAEQRVDIAILEVGMGGRLDSTNVCQPLVTVITSISFDHMQQLGHTLAAIAGEKAGIIKPGVPVVSGVTASQPRDVVAEVAACNHCRLLELNRDFDFTYRPPRRLEKQSSCGQFDYRCRATGLEAEMAAIDLGMLGKHQAANAAVAITSLLELRRQGWTIPEESLRRGLVLVRWPARIEIVGRQPTVVLDTAHNRASVEALVDALEESFSPSPRIAIFGTTRDKDILGMLEVLLPKFDQVVLTRYLGNPRGASPEDLARIAAEIHPAAPHVCADPAAAWELAKRIAGREHLICITGSFFLAAEVRAAMRQRGG